MKYDRELIHSRINKMTDPGQKILLQDIMQDVFRQIIDYTEDSFQKIEEKLDLELKDPQEKFYIYTGVCRKKDVGDTGRFLFEMKTNPDEKSHDILSTVFLTCEHKTILEYFNRKLKCTVTTEQHTYIIDIILRYSKQYLSKIEWLYERFIENKRRWQTINCPYLYKFLDIIDLDGIIPTDEEVTKILIHEPAIENCIQFDMILVWNVQETMIEIEAYKVPGDKITLYEHRIGKIDPKNGYLVYTEESDNLYTVTTEDSLLIRSENKGYDQINLIQIMKYDMEKETTRLAYSLQSNRRLMRHIDRQALLQPKQLATLGEIKRLLTSYEAYESFELKTITFDETDIEGTIDCNPFIHSHNLLKDRKRMLFSLQPSGQVDFLSYELLSFLISELQLYFEEYHCTGKILK